MVFTHPDSLGPGFIKRKERKEKKSELTTTMAPTSSSPPNPKRYVQLRPKEGRLLITFPDGTSGPGDFRRKKHAQSQKNQRDRLKGAFEQMAQVLRDGGVDHAGKGATKVRAGDVALAHRKHHLFLSHPRPSQAFL
ncbi:hypothetical protein P170DRAFT_66866 [Aspergillus steynii IBT 23096]|uniref:BHLH domain-containing protein n=1 Tax=Aspergillus steynii IBT 23096 TaxID=1392250 RepID=A0A2I2FTQ2_9EURO|nr:uncharacterized protein P170DRAFT_66866 [Aspergillus steynii IBT 23096]PLB43981.1 hypothetical protein P170DRAFT_66866 [Aspergillus steynii IBT 23096]